MGNVTAIVISFLRPGYTKACVKSLRATYKDIKIIVGDNGGKYDRDMDLFCREHKADYAVLEFDSGVCRARNELIQRVKTDFVLVGDDDFYYNDDAMVAQMTEFLNKNKHYNVIGGRVFQSGTLRNYQGFIDKYPDHFVTTPIDLRAQSFDVCRHSGLRYCNADLVFNFFVARTSMVRELPWDENIKVAYEHFSWFFDLKLSKYNGTVAFSPDPVVIHKPDFVDPQISADYGQFRLRTSDMEYFYKKYNVEYTIDIHGKRTTAPHLEKRQVQIDRDSVDKVDFCITTFLRHDALERLIVSIGKYYPNASITVADQNEKLNRAWYRELQKRANLRHRISIIKLPFDCGLSRARNMLVRNTMRPYKLILDDDFVFTHKTDIKTMVELMESDKNVSIVGGAVEKNGHIINFEFKLKIENDTIVQYSDGDNWQVYNEIRYKRTGCVLNFALMRGSIFAITGWDDKLKVTEHTDFYLMLDKLIDSKVLYVPSVVVDHPSIERSNEYAEKRNRDEFMAYMFRKHGVKKIRYMSGYTKELMPNGSFATYRTKV